MRVRLIYTIVFLGVIALLTSCSDKKKERQSEAVVVGVVAVGNTSGNEYGDYVGTVVEKTGTSLSFEVPGNIVALRADNGDHVAKGQLLATVDPISLRDAHKMALATLNQAEDAYRRYEPLHKQGVISDIRWVEVQTALEQAQTSERLARTQLTRTSLTAPFAGVISERTAERGMNVMAGQQIFRLVDISSVDVKISVPEKEVSTIKIGAKAKVVVTAVGGQVYDAYVTEKGIEANAVSHTYDVKLAIKHTDGKLMPGMVGRVKLTDVGRSAEGDGAATSGFVIPINALKLDSDNRRFVWLAAGGKAKQQYITLGDFTDNGVIVTSGLAAGDKVITDGSQKVSEGMSVRIRN